MKVVVLSGGVGGAKFVLGLERCEEVDLLTAVVNTADDFSHLGLYVSPDIDTLLYTLSDRANPVEGWGRNEETWQFMDALGSLGGPQWFRLGDRDLAVHVLRSHLLAQGERLSAIVAAFATSWDIKVRILPMTDGQVTTALRTEEGVLPFQEYFVQRQCRPVVQEILFKGSPNAQPAPGVLGAIADADVIFFAPSNPWLSIDPILSIPSIDDALRRARAPCVAISPIVRGQAVKGPTTKLMTELGVAVNQASIAAHYAPWLDGLVHDAAEEAAIKVPSLITSTLMIGIEDKVRVACDALSFAKSIYLRRTDG